MMLRSSVTGRQHACEFKAYKIGSDAAGSSDVPFCAAQELGRQAEALGVAPGELPEYRSLLLAVTPPDM